MKRTDAASFSHRTPYGDSSPGAGAVHHITLGIGPEPPYVSFRRQQTSGHFVGGSMPNVFALSKDTRLSEAIQGLTQALATSVQLHNCWL